MTPLHIAAQGGHLEIVHILVEHKAEVNARDADLQVTYINHYIYYRSPCTLL